MLKKTANKHLFKKKGWRGKRKTV